MLYANSYDSQIENKTDIGQQGNKLQEKAVKILALTIVVLAVIGIILGLANKAVFYSDGKDVICSFFPFLVPLVLYTFLLIIGSIFEFSKWYEKIIIGAVILTSIGCSIAVFYTSLRENQGNKFFALTVTLGKIMLSFLCIFMFQQLTGWDKNKSAGENWASRANAALWLAAILGLMKLLINRDKVFERRAVPAIAS